MLIAEIGQNHNGDFSLAKELVYAAKESGADIAKFQAYDAKSLFPKENNPWFEYNCSTELTHEQLVDLANLCNRIGIEFMASPFDVKRVQWLEKIGVKRFKLASRSILDLELIEEIKNTKKEVIVSLGFWTDETFPDYFDHENTKYLYCVSKYPTSLRELKFTKNMFTKYDGFSDHTIGNSAVMVALTLGAKIIEKHFTLNKKMSGPDHAGSAEPDDFRQIKSFMRDLELIYGK